MSEDKRGVLEFSTPPPERSHPYDWDLIAEQLRVKPGEWAKVFEHDRTSLAVALRRGRIKALHPDAGFRLRTTDNTRDEPRTCTLFMCYLPEADMTKEK